MGSMAEARVRSQADFHHRSRYVSRNKPRLFLTLGSSKIRVSQEAWNFFCRQRVSLKDFKQELDIKELHFRQFTSKRIGDFLRGKEPSLKVKQQLKRRGKWAKVNLEGRKRCPPQTPHPSSTVS